MKQTLVFALAVLFVTCLSTPAQNGTLLSPSVVPQTGTFFSTQDRPSSPFDWLPDLPVYAIGQGSFLIDDSSVNYSAVGATGVLQPANGAMDSGVPAPPGELVFTWQGYTP
jgi:hypothetical protein